jgi:hypothetical protein
MKHTSLAADAPELIREHLEEVLSSKTFENSLKVCHLLQHLVEAALTGNSEPIKEQLLGIEVFDRPNDWDPQTESVVRVEVKRLRDLLALYYEKENTLTPVRFVVPKGCYKVLSVLTAQHPTRLPEHLRANEKPNCHEEENGEASVESTHSAPGAHVRGIRLQRLTHERGDVTNAAFGPDGESVVYSARWGGDPARIYTQRIGQKYSRPLGLPYGELRDVSATGQLLFTLGEGFTGTLAQAELSGGPWREIVDGVLDAVWLPDNKHIAAARLEDGEMRIELPLGNPVHCLTGKQNRIRLSVDETGERIAFVDNSLGPLDFCIADRTGNVRRISKGWRLSGNVLWWSRNQLVISGARRGVAAIHSVDLDSHERPLYPTPTGWDLHDCTPDGRLLASCVDSRLHVAFRTPSMESEGRLFPLVNTRLIGLSPDARFAVLMDLLGDGVARNSAVLLAALPAGQPVQIAEGYHPQLAPDGKAVICLEHDKSESAIVVTPIPTGLPRRYPLSSGPKYHSAEFSGIDGRFLLHLHNDHQQGLHTHVFEPESGRLSPIPGKLHLTKIAPDGNWGVVLPAGLELRLGNVESGDIRKVCDLPAGWSPVRWSTSGNEIFVFEPGKDYATGNILRINIQTGEKSPWLSLHPADTVGTYLLRWVDVTPDGRSYAYTYQQDLGDLYILDGLI